MSKNLIYNTEEKQQTVREEAKKKKGTKEQKNNKKPINKRVISTYLSIITININRLNASIKYPGEWIKKISPKYMQPTKDFRSKVAYRLKVKGWKGLPCKQKQKERQKNNIHI